MQAASYTLGTNTLNVAGVFTIPTAGTININITIFSGSLYGKTVPVGAASIGDALTVNATSNHLLSVLRSPHYQRPGAVHGHPDSAGGRGCPGG